MEGTEMNGFSTKRSNSLHKKLKAVIGYWTDYYYGKTDTVVSFKINGKVVSVSYRGDNYYEIHYLWMTTPVHVLDIFDTLDFYEAMLKAMD